MSELKPCPFCKKPAKSWKQGIIGYKLCACSNGECAAAFTKFTPEEWNTRSSEAQSRVDEVMAQAVMLRKTLQCVSGLGYPGVKNAIEQFDKFIAEQEAK